ncbi:MAG: protein kinase [Anaerolineae bacterium]|nr:protein kinase [Anaerolineae bacterium]
MASVSLEGQTLGKYQILEPLGRGGMARVYRAYHPQLDRYVAVKVLRSDLVEDQEFLARFRREAQAVATLRHPNIVQVYDFDVQDELYYIVLELLGGDTLKVRLTDYHRRGEQMPWGEMVRILLDVLDGLAYAHSEGMIHRDIKPANILLTRRGQAVLADFGIAQIIGGTNYTASGALMGTLNYMAPEQGFEGHSDARSDIYSLGIVFYEMLTNRTPFEADTPLAVLMKHLNDPLPLPRKINQAIPEPFERVVLKALAKNPADRYQSAAEMARALREAADEALLDLPDRISLPLSFTTADAPAEAVAIFSGTAREKLAEADFADDDTDASLGERLDAALSAFEAKKEHDKQAHEGSFKELMSAVWGMARIGMGEATQALREAAEEEQQKLQKKRAAKQRASASGESLADQAALGHADAALSRRLEERLAHLRGERSSLESEYVSPKQRRTIRKAERAARKQARQKAAAECGPGCCGGIGQSILSGLTLIIVANLVILWIAGVTDRWEIYEIGWPVQLLLVGMALCMVMLASGSIWLLIPIGIIAGNGVLFTYYSLTDNWNHWDFLWPLEPLLVIVTVWFAIVMAGRGNFSCRLARFLGMLLWVGGAGMIGLILMLIWPWFYNAALDYYNFGLEMWANLNYPAQ